MNHTPDWFDWLVIASCAAIPSFLWLRYCKRKSPGFDWSDELTRTAMRNEDRARAKFARTAAFDRMRTVIEPVIAYRAPTPSSKAPDAKYHPVPSWSRKPEDDDPAPLFDARVAEVRMHVEQPSFAYDTTPENDNAVRKTEER